jgi:hypothetical protein
MQCSDTFMYILLLAQIQTTSSLPDTTSNIHTTFIIIKKYTISSKYVGVFLIFPQTKFHIFGLTASLVTVAKS